MANTYTQVYFQTIFAIKYRKAMIHPYWKSSILGVIGTLINDTDCKCIVANGVEDHVHCFFRLKPTLSLSKVMQTVKAKSSKWINDQEWLRTRFEWQRGYGAFSYHQSLDDKVYHYIQNQERHHQKRSFKEEYKSILNAFQIEYNEDYLFHELI